ncbi:MAG: MBL fold metallo-hydrolase [Lachnospiraceae bacterium]|nr:MBL fold metallo-hydrolase [Lachnospiraceae bacterium]
MHIQVLMEDKKVLGPDGRDAFLTEHGLSLWIETKNRVILFDTGQSGAFLKNAQKLGLDLREVDMVILSHGHYDHTGGLAEFLQVNQKAKVYIRETALKKLYHVIKEDQIRDIGLPQSFMEAFEKDRDRFVLTKGDVTLEEGISLFTNVTKRKCYPGTNLVLKCGEKLEQDLFDHEQNLILSEEGKDYLICGCAHNGIINIIEEYEERTRRKAQAVIGGFHTGRKSGLTQEDMDNLQKIGAILKERSNQEGPYLYYTGHCTGQESYDILKSQLGDHLKELSTGSKMCL